MYGTSGISGSALQQKSQLGIANQAHGTSADSLASISPRLILLSEQVASASQHLAASLGIIDDVPSSGSSETAPMVLINALQFIEKNLQFAMSRLESINQHING